MITRKHKVSIYVNNQILELNDADGLNLRINNVIYDPTKISSTQSEYSFTFDIPVTPNNTRVFDFANVLSKINKFTKLYSAIVYSDGKEFFRGQLRISSITDNNFKCNLVSVKVNTVEDIFGESTMNEVIWRVPYTGMETINEINEDLSTNYYFPLVCYGVFQKVPQTVYFNEINSYTSKYLLDKYVQWYDESFMPSVKLNTLIKKMFELKGYNVTGDIFEDDIANGVYLSTSLGDKQIPTYNLANPVIGECTVKWNFKNRKKIEHSSGWTAFTLPPLEHTLTYPHKYVSGENYNFTVANFWNMWYYCNIYKNYKSPENDLRPNIGALGLSIEADNKNMWRDGYIVIPADGAYKIDLDIDMDINDAEQMEGLFWVEDSTKKVTRKVNPIIHTDMPIEIHLLRNSNEGELIYGNNVNDRTIYPHEAPNTADTSNMGQLNTGSTGTLSGEVQRTLERLANGGTSRHNGAKTTKSPSATGTTTDSRGGDVGINPITGEPDEDYVPEENYHVYNMGYMPKTNEMLAFDPWVNSDFICGLSTIGQCPAVIKNGYSWNSECLDKNYSRYNCDGYWGVDYTDGHFEWEKTTYNRNTYKDAPESFVDITTLTAAKGHVSCVVYLKRNDVLSLQAVCRNYEQEDGSNNGLKPGQLGVYKPTFYEINVSGTFHISSYSPKESDVESDSLNYNSPSKFDYDLNLGEFLNNEEKQADFVNNFIKAYNLYFASNGKNIILNKNKLDFDMMNVPISFDDRVNNKNISVRPIDYPKSMQVEYKIDDEEAGFYNSVPKDKLNGDDWKDYAFIGSEKIELSQYEDAEETEVSLSNSYTWYNDFKVHQYDSDGNISHTVTISLPIISKDEYMIENYKYEESMSVDGKGLPQRWFFRQPVNDELSFVTVNDEPFKVSIPINEKDGFKLNYMNNENTLLTRYFNIDAYISSDQIEFETYLSSDEYNLLKKGCPIKINNDIYLINEITGFDPSGYNLTKIKAMKKV